MHQQLADIVTEFNLASARVLVLHRDLAAGRWNRRPAPERWSPSDCVAHLNLTAIAMMPLIRHGLDEARRSRFKSKTIPAFVPTSDRSAEEVMAEFDRLQEEQIVLTRAAAGLPIDRVKMSSPFNANVRYNIFSALSILPRHQHRHLWQAEQAGR